MKQENSIPLLLVALVALTAIGSALCGSAPPEEPAPIHWPDCATGTGNIFNATTIVIPDSVAGSFLSNGDILGVFDQTGDCVGQELYREQVNFAIPVWGDDPLTPEKDGAVVGSALSLRGFIDTGLAVQTDVPFNYADDAVYVLERIGYPGAPFDSLSYYRDQLNQLSADLLNTQQERDLYLQQRNNARNQRDTYLAQRNQLQAKVDSIRVIVQ